jgi:hypothetical protein
MNETSTLRKSSASINPFTISIDDNTYYMKDIILYKSDGVCYHTNRGWFGSGNNDIPSLAIPSVVKRRQARFDGKTFFIVNSGKSITFGKRDGTLYMPFEFFQFERTIERETISYRIIRTPVYVSRLDPRITLVARVEATREEDEDLKEEYQALTERALQLADELRKVEDRIVEIDSGHQRIVQ